MCGHGVQSNFARGGRSSIRLEHQVVVLGVGGSNPLGHPKFGRSARKRAAGRIALGRASSSIWQSNGLLIRRFGVRVPGGPPTRASAYIAPVVATSVDAPESENGEHSPRCSQRRRSRTSPRRRPQLPSSSSRRPRGCSTDGRRIRTCPLRLGTRFTFAAGPDPVYLIALTARNHARRPTMVVSWAIALPDDRTVASPLLLGLAPYPGTPTMLKPRGQQTWYAPAAPIEELMRSAGYAPSTPLRGVVCLPEGVEVASGQTVSLASLGVGASAQRVPSLPARVAHAGFTHA